MSPTARIDNSTATMRTLPGADTVSIVIWPLPWERAEGAHATSLITRGNTQLPTMRWHSQLKHLRRSASDAS